jgi:hypothetical protein
MFAPTTSHSPKLLSLCARACTRACCVRARARASACGRLLLLHVMA